MLKNEFECIVCRHRYTKKSTPFKPRDRKDLDIVDCPKCGHRQLFPLLSEQELVEEYNEDKTVRSTSLPIAPGTDFNAMRQKFSEWTKIHADMYWEKLQSCKYVLNIGSGYGFLEEELNKRDGKLFQIEGNEIGKFRLDNYVGGIVHNIDFLKEQVPEHLAGKYDLIMGLHILEHINKPVEYLRKLKALLKPKGCIIIEVPNLNSFLCELSKEYEEWFYLYEHVSYFTEKTLVDVFQRAGYKVTKVYSKEVYSIENHINWIRTGKPFIKYNQMYLPDARIEFINEEYKKKISEMGKGYALIIEACIMED